MSNSIRSVASGRRRSTRAATTDLPIEVWVKDGVAFLRGRVPGIEDAEEVAGRLPEVRNVVEQLEITNT